MLLSKIAALKKQLDAARPFSLEIQDNLEKWFAVELTYASNAIEGNTLTRMETALVLDTGITIGGKPMKDHLEAINHQAALNYLKNLVHQTKISLDAILEIHHLILKGIDDTNAGVIRRVPVRIAGSTVILPNPLKVPQLLDEMMEWVQETHDNSISFAALAHYKLVTIHPFLDGNGRTGRLLMNLILMQHGYPPAIISPKDRLAYIKSLEQAQLGGPLDDYLNLMYQAGYKSLQIYLKALRHEPPTMTETADNLLRIGALAKATQESTSTLRYWTKTGLISIASTTASGYQLYSRETIARCQKIRHLQSKRYTLDEIAQM
jgi:Fic family protein